MRLFKVGKLPFVSCDEELTTLVNELKAFLGDGSTQRLLEKTWVSAALTKSSCSRTDAIIRERRIETTNGSEFVLSVFKTNTLLKQTELLPEELRGLAASFNSRDASFVSLLDVAAGFDRSFLLTGLQLLSIDDGILSGLIPTISGSYIEPYLVAFYLDETDEAGMVVALQIAVKYDLDVVTHGNKMIMLGLMKDHPDAGYIQRELEEGIKCKE